MEETSKQTLKSLFQLLSKPFRVLLSTAFAIMGVSLFGVIGFAGWFMYSSSSFDNHPSWKLIILIAFGVLAVSALVIAFLSLLALTKVKYDALNVEGISLQMETAANKLKETLTNKKVSSYILSSNQIGELESSVKKDCSIIVLTSQFKLDSGSFVDIILQNIRKGVTYKYLVPDIEQMTEEFDKTCKGWWDTFWTEIQNRSKDIRGIKGKGSLQKMFPDASSKYLEVLLDVANEKELNSVEKKARSYFCDHVQEFIINKEHSLVTIIMYQMDRGTSSKAWEIIMKLSTEIDDNEYYAFKIPEEEEAEKDRLYCRIRDDLCNNMNKRKLSVED